MRTSLLSSQQVGGVYASMSDAVTTGAHPVCQHSVQLMQSLMFTTNVPLAPTVSKHHAQHGLISTSTARMGPWLTCRIAACMLLPVV
jgi:hypothetical protein